MNSSFGSTPEARRGERGAARLKFIIVLAVVALFAYMGFQYVPVAYNSYLFKDVMKTTLNSATNVPPDQQTSWVRQQLASKAKDYGVPADARINPTLKDGRLEVTVQFTRPVNLLPGFTYNYNFDYTAKSSDFLSP